MKVISAFVIFVLLFGCSTNRIKPAKEDVTAIKRMVEKSVVEQTEFLNRRQSAETESDYTIESEKIFDAFWNPKKLSQYSESGEVCEWVQDLCNKAEYLIVQTEYRVAISRLDEWPETIVDFASSLERWHTPNPENWNIYTNSNFISKAEAEGCKILHLTPKVKSELVSCHVNRLITTVR